MRAIRARYSPYVQARGRVDQLRKLGHSVDKVGAGGKGVMGGRRGVRLPLGAGGAGPRAHAAAVTSCRAIASPLFLPLPPPLHHPPPSTPPPTPLHRELHAPRWSSSLWAAPSCHSRVTTATTSYATSTTRSAVGTSRREPCAVAMRHEFLAQRKMGTRRGPVPCSMASLPCGRSARRRSSPCSPHAHPRPAPARRPQQQQRARGSRLQRGEPHKVSGARAATPRPGSTGGGGLIA